MKILLLQAFLCLTLFANATNYYISTSGNDANNGTSESTSWKSLNKLNSYFSLLKPGDNVLLNRGDIFYGNIIVNASGAAGSPITISAYGIGPNPVVTGFTTVTNWTNLGGNIWESTDAVSTLSNCNTVAINGVNTPMGRWPNSGYLTYQSFSGNTSITSSSLNSAITNWTGAEAVIKKDRYIVDRNPIISQSGGTLTYSGGGSYNGQNNWGFFIQNDSRTLDTANEWYYNPTQNKMRIYSPTIPFNVQLSTVDTLMCMVFKSYVTISSITFTGANKIGISIYASHHIYIQNCELDFCYNGILGDRVGSSNSSNNFMFQNSIINHSNNNGLSTTDEFTNAIITNNIIKNSGILIGMSGSGDGKAQGMNINGAGSVIQSNEVDSSGYVGIGFDANSVTVTNNLVDYFCLVKDDGGGIYTDNSHVNVVISYNTVLHGIGTGEGTAYPTTFRAAGIYCDDHSSGMSVLNNVVANTNHAGIFLHNAKDISVVNNTTYNCGLGLLVNNDDINSYTTNLNVKNNIFFSKTTGITFSPYDQRTIDFKSVHTSGNNIATFGSVDSNYYVRPIDDNLTIRGTVGPIDNNYSLLSWQSYSGFDAHSLKSPKVITDTSDLRFEYNVSSSPKTLNLDANYIDAKDKSFNGSITLAPYTAAILIKNGTIINQAPRANAGQDQTITLPKNSLTLSGSGSDPDGTIISYQWVQILGPSAAIIENISSPGTTILGLAEGIYDFQLKVTDNNGGTASDTVRVTVNPMPNQPPVANAGNDQAIYLPVSAVVLTGSGSDPDGNIASYQWAKVSGPSSVNIMNPSSGGTDVTGLVQGIYQFQLTVTDNKGATATDVVLVTVNPAANISPIANAGPDMEITLPLNSITLSGSGSDTDGTVSGYSWIQISGPVNDSIESINSPVTKIIGLVDGVYQFQFQVTDDKGAIGTDMMQVTVNAAPNIPPVANAGPDQTITFPVDSVALSGSGIDPDGTTSSYQWTVLSGASGYNIGDPNSAITSITGLSQGVYQLQLEVKDNNGAIATDIMQITVNAAPNLPPVANAGSDQTVIMPVDTLKLGGSGSDVDGTIASYLWTILSGPAGCNILNPDLPATDITGLSQGIYKFQLQVTDNDGATATDIVLITVNGAPNISPIADAGADRSIALPTSSIILLGSGTDADGTISSYAWSQLSGPSFANIFNADSSMADITHLVEGVYQFQLHVTDNNGAIGTDIVQVNVSAVPNFPPIADAGSDQSITFPLSTAMLSGSGHDTDGTVIGYKWSQLSGPSSYNIVNSDSAITDVMGLVQGTYQFQLQVTDDKGAIGSDIVAITVSAPGNIAPVANAGLDQSITLPVDTLVLSGSGTDADGPIVNYSWTKLSGPSSYNIENPDSAFTKVTGLIEGIYLFQLTVADNGGATATDILSVTVNPAFNLPPAANAGLDQSITLPVDSITLAGSGTDVDGTIVNYHWATLSGPSSYNITNADSSKTDVIGLAQGIYLFQLTVMDNNGATATDVVSITVNKAANIPPVANAGSDLSVTLPIDTLTLSGSGNDPDGSIVGYKWTQLSGPSSSNIISANLPTTPITGLMEGVYQFQLQVIDNNSAIGTDLIQVTVEAAANIPPTANAGPDQTITLPEDSLMLSGSGGDTDGVVTNFLWTKISGPSFYTITNATSSSTNVTGMVQGVYLFELRVTDDNGATSVDTMQLTVDPDTNIPPVANAGVDQIITLPTNSITLSGDGTDADGTVVAYNWTKISGPSGYDITNPTSASTAVTGLVQGLYLFELQVTDNSEAIAFDTIQVNVNIPNNISPVADAGVDQAITLPTDSVIFSGNGADPDGTIIGYRWVQISGPSTSNILDATSSSTAVNGLVAGVYQFQLKVSDNSGATGTDVVQVTVDTAVNILPIADAGTDQVIKLPVNSTTLLGNASDSDGIIIGYEWTKISGSSTGIIVHPDSANTAVTGLVKGIYKFQLRVIDNSGGTGIDIVKITVNGTGNIAPVADAGLDQSIVLPKNAITLSGSGTDADGSVVGYEWTVISGPGSYNIVSANSPVTEFTGLVEGVYQLQLKVTDNKGAIGIDLVQVTVNPAPNQPPLVNAGLDNIIILPVNNISLLGSASDSDGSIVSYHWIILSGPSVPNITDSLSALTDVNGLVEGIYQFELRVTDNSGAAATDVIQVTVKPAPNQAPVANAGPDTAITLPTNVVTVSGSSIDVDGTVVNYQWLLISGPSTPAIANSASATTIINGLAQGVYQFELTVTDNSGSTGTDIMQVTVKAAANQPPVANAGMDQIITLPANTITILGEGTDADGSIVNYEWSKISGPSSCNIVSPSAAGTTVSGLVQGVYQFQLRVTDNNGATATDILQVIVNASPNQAPLANAGIDQMITLPTNSLTLSGAGTDADGSIATYQWTKISGPVSSNILSPTTASTQINALVEGIYQFQLKVTDNSGATATDIVKVTVKAAPNVPPIANAGPDKILTLPVNSLSFSGSGSDSDGSVVSYQWSKISGPSSYQIVDSISASTIINSLVEGVYQFELKVTDNDGAIAIDEVQLTVNPAPNVPPVANAGADKIITLPTDFLVISGTGSDTDGNIASYQWTKISGSTNYNLVDSARADVKITDLKEGVYQFQLKVTDNKGASSTDVVQLTVNAAPNVPPLANAGPDRIIYLPTNSITISGSGSDGDGTIVRYFWTKISGPASYNITNQDTLVATIQDLVQGIYQFQLKVTDNRGGTAIDIVQVTVNAPANQPPAANAGIDKVITLPTNSLVVSGSANDADGVVASYQWSKISGPTTYNIVDPTSAVTTINALLEGTYLFELRVTDNNGARGRDTMQVTVKAAANIPPQAHAGGDITITLPVNTVSLAGSGSDVSATIVSYVWSKISGPSSYNITNASSPVTDVWGLKQGIYQFELKVTDNKGANGFDTIRIIVNAANTAPVANAGQDRTITLPTNEVTVVGSGTDSDGTISGYSWKQISGPSSSVIDSANSSTTPIHELVGGTYKFELTVADNLGATDKDTVTIVVTEPRLNTNRQSIAIKAYPNPMIDVTSIEINTTRINSNLRITISDMRGLVVYKREILATQSNITSELNLSTLAKGIYILTVDFSRSERASIKISKL